MGKSIPIFKRRYYCSTLFLLSLFLLLFRANVSAQEWEAESGTLSNGADIQNCTPCGGTKLVGNLGGTNNGTLTNTVNVGSAGDYLLTMYYASGDPRSIYVTVNNNNPGVKLDCKASGGWTTVANTSIIVNLKAGENTIKFDNPSDWGPNIDKFALGNNQRIAFGTGNFIDYSLVTGKYDVYFNNTKVISDAYAEAKTPTATLSSINYPSRVYSSSAISDNFGSGTKHIISLSGNGLVPMDHIFYTYSGKSYFFTEIVLNGTGVKSNYIAPLVATSVSLPFNGDNRALFVPFDNDAFVRYDSKALSSTQDFTSSEVSAIYDNTSRKALIAGAVEQTDWKSGITIAGRNTALTKFSVFSGLSVKEITRDEGIAHGMVGGNSNTVKSAKMLVGYFEDWRTGLEEYGKSQKIAQPQYIFKWDKPTPFGWNSWGKIQTTLNAQKATAVVDFFANDLKEFRNDNTLFIDLDAWWDFLSDDDLRAFAKRCKDNGLTPGIYWGPFVDWGWKDDPNGDRTVEGSFFKYKDAWTKVNGQYHDMDGGRAMDPTSPATKRRIDWMVNKLFSLGMEMVKVDFLGHGAIEADQFYDPNVTTGMQAYRQGMEYIVDKLASKEILVYAAISPSLATGRYVHTRRIACDAWSSIDNTQYTLNSTNYGWWQTFVYNYIDADHIVLDGETDGVNRARIASGLINGTFFTGDDFSTTGQWATRAKNYFQNQELLDIARNGVAFKPVDGNTATNANNLFVREIGNYTYVAAFNYNVTSQTSKISLERLGLNNAQTYRVKELFGGNVSVATGTLDYTLTGRNASIFRLQLGGTEQQTINFNAIGSKTVDQKEFEVLATATSGLPVSFTSSNTNVATVEGNKIVIKAAGSTTITATQPGNETWLPATTVSRVLTITKGNQSIQFEPASTKGINAIDYDPEAVASSGLKVTYSSSNLAVATIVRDKVHILKEGTTIITATQAGNENWLPAAAVSQTLTVTGSFQLPASNFKISVTDESCINSKNGSIGVLATEQQNYRASITGNNLNKNYTFNRDLNIPDLGNGIYRVCLTVEGTDFNRCYDLVVKSPQPLSVYSYVNKSDNKLELSLSGSLAYNIQLNGKLYNSTSDHVSLEMNSGVNTLVVTTEKECQGIFEQQVFLNDKKTIYPNPFESHLFINMANDQSTSADITIYNEAGKKVYNKKHSITDGQIALNLPNLSTGIYLLHVKTNYATTSSKIVKK